MMINRKAFVVVLVIAIMGAIIPVALTIEHLALGEILQTRLNNDTAAAYYVAFAGAERSFAYFRDIDLWHTDSVITFPRPTMSGSIVVDGNTIGTYTVDANLISLTQLGIVAQGVVNGHTARLTAKYGCAFNNMNGLPLGSGSSVSLDGSQWWIFTSWVYVDGPVSSNSTISSNAYVQVFGDKLENQTNPMPDFWWKYDSGSNSWVKNVKYDTNGDGNRISDTNGDGKVTIADCGGDPAKEAIYMADHPYHPGGDARSGEITDKDAFYNYYTHELNNKNNLGIGPGQPNYYTGTRTLGPTTVPAGTSIIFVDGDVNIIFNAQKWWGSKSDFTVVSMNDITIVQPVNGSDDRLNLIAAGNVVTGGINLGDIADVDGNLNMFADGTFTAILGGVTNG